MDFLTFYIISIFGAIIASCFSLKEHFQLYSQIKLKDILGHLVITIIPIINLIFIIGALLYFTNIIEKIDRLLNKPIVKSKDK